VINLTEALTVGVGAVFETDVPENDTATIIWNVGAAVYRHRIRRCAFVGGAFGAATSDVSCGNIYATGAVSVGSIGADADGLDDTTLGEPVACDTNAPGLADFAISGGELVQKFSPNMVILIDFGETIYNSDPQRWNNISNTENSSLPNPLMADAIDTSGNFTGVYLVARSPRGTPYDYGVADTDFTQVTTTGYPLLATRDSMYAYDGRGKTTVTLAGLNNLVSCDLTMFGGESNRTNRVAAWKLLGFLNNWISTLIRLGLLSLTISYQSMGK
jgi:hypothetical protein